MQSQRGLAAENAKDAKFYLRLRCRRLGATLAKCRGREALRQAPDLSTHALATFAARKLLALLVGQPDAFGAGASRRWARGDDADPIGNPNLFSHKEQ